MRKWLCVPTMTLCLLLSGCGGGERTDIRQPFREMEGCTAEARVSCTQEDTLWEAELHWDWTPESAAAEVLAPESIAGIRATLTGTERQLAYENLCLDAGELGASGLGPVDSVPWLISALREGWLLEENREEWEEIPCCRLLLDQTGPEGEKLLTAVWLRLEDGLPLRGEVTAAGEQILTVEFTDFAICDTINPQTNP